MKVSHEICFAPSGIRRTVWRVATSAGSGAALLMLSACGGPELAFYSGVVSIASLSETGKGPIDHVVSYQTDKDCSIVHVDERRDYCIDHNAEDQLALTPPPSYCYQTLGSVECFTRPDTRRDTPALGSGSLALR
jgi:hypothetical protein